MNSIIKVRTHSLLEGKNMAGKISKEAKEQQILDAALKIFSEKGFASTTTSEIAKEAGIAEGTIFRYFNTKKDILRKIMIKAIELIAPEAISKPIELLSDTQGKEARQILVEILKERVTFLSTRLPLIKTVFAEAMFHEDIRETLRENIIIKVRVTFEKFFDNMLIENKIRNCDRTSAMRIFIGSIITMIVYHQIFNIKLSPQEWDKEIEKTVDILMYGLIPEPLCGGKSI